MAIKLSSENDKALALRADCVPEHEICARLSLKPKQLDMIFNKTIDRYEARRNRLLAEALAKRRAEGIYTRALTDYEDAFKTEDRAKMLAVMLKAHESLCQLDGLDAKSEKAVASVNVGNLTILNAEQMNAIVESAGAGLGIRPYHPQTLPLAETYADTASPADADVIDATPSDR